MVPYRVSEPFATYIYPAKVLFLFGCQLRNCSGLNHERGWWENFVAPCCQQWRKSSTLSLYAIAQSLHNNHNSSNNNISCRWQHRLLSGIISRSLRFRRQNRIKLSIWTEISILKFGVFLLNREKQNYFCFIMFTFHHIHQATIPTSGTPNWSTLKLSSKPQLWLLSAYSQLEKCPYCVLTFHLNQRDSQTSIINPNCQHRRS